MSNITRLSDHLKEFGKPKSEAVQFMGSAFGMLGVKTMPWEEFEKRCDETKDELDGNELAKKLKEEMGEWKHRHPHRGELEEMRNQLKEIPCEEL